MLHTLEPEKSARMRARRLEEFPADRIILSSCQGCLGSFKGQGRETLHLLELLFGKSRKQGWKNRSLRYLMSRYRSAISLISTPARYI